MTPIERQILQNQVDTFRALRHLLWNAGLNSRADDLAKCIEDTQACMDANADVRPRARIVRNPGRGSPLSGHPAKD